MAIRGGRKKQAKSIQSDAIKQAIEMDCFVRQETKQSLRSLNDAILRLRVQMEALSGQIGSAARKASPTADL
jgi:hypothetical protein